jgi:MFS family permease
VKIWATATVGAGTTYPMKELHLPQSTGFTATLVGAIVLGLTSPSAGHLSDKFGRSGILTGTAWLFFLTTYPLFCLMVACSTLATAVFCRRLAEPCQGGLWRGAALATLRTVPDPRPRDRRFVELRRRGDGLWRLHTLRINLADRKDR